AKTNHVSQRWLQETIDLLWDRRQIIFYGPPGTGKTYLARKIAYHLTHPDNVSLVQFHPAYSYEDFFEGYRPAPPTDDGRVGFQLTPGPFRRLVNNAKNNPATPHILIIDEINRANLAKVFGELYFLLEYRDETIDLLYSTGDKAGFTLPDNVFIIGTMNTADRSIALVDAAMRRRFAFLHLHPQEEPTNTILRGWLKHNGHDETLADLHDELNTRIDDPDFAIGPSYFMRPEVRRPGGLERTWRTAILPLLVEYHYGEDIDINARYGLDTFTHKPDTDN
ncbi:McrB family protein, partial [Dermatophilus congolensis]